MISSTSSSISPASSILPCWSQARQIPMRASGSPGLRLSLSRARSRTACGSFRSRQRLHLRKERLPLLLVPFRVEFPVIHRSSSIQYFQYVRELQPKSD